ncbi:MAG: peptidoglycan-binding protein [Alphaproteobacteria bacterium]|nr:peptidoglycan-binding protein [Alphaproteobacteria bacterium]
MPFSTDRKPFAGLRSTIGRDDNIEPEDVRGAKSALAQLGDYDPTPAGGVDGIPDRGFFKSLESYQSHKGLKVDGLMRPGGETERALKTDLAGAGGASDARPSSSARSGAGGFLPRQETDSRREIPYPTTIPQQRAEPDPAEAAREKRLKEIAARNRKAWRAQQRARLQRTQAAAQAASQPAAQTQADPAPDDALDRALTGLQRALSLPRDGVSRPKGESEAQLNELIQPMIQRASASVGNASERAPEEFARKLASLGMEDHGAWGNPFAWALEEAGKAIAGAVDDATPAIKRDDSTLGRPENSADDVTGGDSRPPATEAEEIEWEEKPAISGHRGGLQLNTDGPIRIDLNSTTLGIDGLEYQVRWYALNEDGSVIPNLTAPPSFWKGDGSARTYRGLAGASTGQSQILRPPFDSPHGYRVDIRVRPGEAYHGNSAGVDMSVFSSAGGRVNPVQGRRP